MMRANMCDHVWLMNHLPCEILNDFFFPPVPCCGFFCRIEFVLLSFFCICNLRSVVPPPSHPRTPLFSPPLLTHARAHPLTHICQSYCWKPILPSPSSFDSVSIRSIPQTGWSRIAGDEVPGKWATEIQPRGRGSRPHSVSAQLPQPSLANLFLCILLRFLFLISLLHPYSPHPILKTEPRRENKWLQ